MKVGIEKSSNKIVLLLLPVILLITLSTTVSGLPVFQEVKMTPNKAVVGKNVTLEFVVNVTDNTGANITNVGVENVSTVGKLSLTYNSTTGKWEGNVTIDTATITPNVYTLIIYAENETKYVTTKTVNLTIFDFKVSAGVSKLVLGGETTITVSTTPQVKGVEVYLSVNRTEDTIDGASNVTKTTDENGEVKATLKVGANNESIINPYQGKITANISGVTKEFVYTVDKLHLDIKLNETVLTKGSGTVAEVIIENPTEQAVKDATIDFDIKTPDGLTSTIAYMEKLAVVNAGATVKPYVVTYEVQGREVYFYVKDYNGNIVKEYGPFAIGITPGIMKFKVTLNYHQTDPKTKVEYTEKKAEIINLASTNITKVVAEITNFTIIDPNGNEYKDKPYIAYPWDKIRYNLTLRNPSTLGNITYKVKLVDPSNVFDDYVTVPANSSVNLTFVISGLYNEGTYNVSALVTCGNAKLRIVQEFKIVVPHAKFLIENVNTGETGEFVNAVRGDTIKVTYVITNPGKYTLGDDPKEPSANLLLRVITPEGKVIQLDQRGLLIPKGVTVYNKTYAIPKTGELGVYRIKAGFSMGTISTAEYILSPETQAKINDAIKRGLKYLRDTQNPDGSWGSWCKVGHTGLAVLAFLGHGVSENDPTVKAGIKYILSKVHEDGSIYDDPWHKTYETATAIMALARTGNPAYKEIINKAAEWLIKAQHDEEDGISKDNWWYGGWGYNEWTRPDLSNTQFAIVALKAAGVPENHEVWKKAIVFLQRCQNLKDYNDQWWAGNDGGFVYNPEWSLAGDHCSYGSMTAAGIWCMRLCGLSVDDPRVQAALKWFDNYYAYDINPAACGSMGCTFYYYYLWSAAKAFIVCGITDRYGLMTPTNPGDQKGWYYDFAMHLIKVQRDDGSWNDCSCDSIVNTAFALLTLERELGVKIGVKDEASFAVDVDEVRVSNLTVTPNPVLENKAVTLTFNVTRVGPEFNNEFNNSVVFAPAAFVSRIGLAGAYVAIEPEVAILKPGETGIISITAYNMTDLAGFGIRLYYDPSVVIVTNVAANEVLGYYTAYKIYNDVGRVDLAGFKMSVHGSGNSGSFWLFKIELKAVGKPGDSCKLKLDIAKMVHSDGTEFQDEVDVVDGTVKIIDVKATAIDIPANVSKMAMVPIWAKVKNIVNSTTVEIETLWKPSWAPEFDLVTFKMPIPSIVQPDKVVYMNIRKGTNIVISVSEPITLEPDETKTVTVYVPSDGIGMHDVATYVDVFLTNTRGDIYPYSVGQYVHGDDYLYGTFTTVMAPKIVITDVAVPKLVDPYYYPYKYIVVGIGCEFYANVTLKNVGGLSGSDVLEVYVTDLSGNVTYYHDASNVSLQPYELKTVQVKVKAPDQEGTFVVIFRTNNSEYRLIMYTRSIEITGLRILDSNLNETDAFHHGDVMVIEVNATNYGCLQASKNVTVGMTLMLYVPEKPTTPFAYYGLYYYPMYIPIMTKSFEIKLSGKESESYRIAFKIPDDLPNGNYIVGVWPEEYPNYDMIIGCPYYADKAIIGYGELKIINMTLTPTTISPGQFVMANVTIKNVGELKAWGTLKLIEEGPTIKTIQPKKIEAMNSGDVKTVTVTIFNTAEKGTYKVTPVIESYGSAKPIYVSPGPNLQLETEPMSDDIVVGIIGPGPNNVLETTPVNDDRAIKFNLSLEFDLVIIAGPNGILESNVSGDDYIIPTSIGDIIVPGANKVLDTIPSGDDAIVHIGVDIPDITVQFIVPGPNGILETRPNGDDVIHGAILPGKNLVLDTTKAKGDDVVIEAEEVFKVNYGKPGIFKTEIPKPSVWMKPIQPKICDNVTIFAEFMNPGIVPMNILAKLVVTKPNGEMLNFSKIVMVPANGTKVVSFTFHVDMGGNWSYNFNGVTGAFYVVKPASLTIVDIVQPDKVPQNWTMKISVIIGNEGDLAGNDTLILKIIEAKTKTELYNESRIVSVPPHGTVVENFTYTPTKEGAYITHAELVKFAKYKDKRFTVIGAAPVFEVTVSPIEQTVGVKENATFTVVVKNVGTKNATNVTLTVLNANWSQVTPTKVDVLAINQSVTFTVTVKMDVAGDYKLMFNVTCDEGVSTFGTATLHVLKVFKPKPYSGHVGLDKEVYIDTIPAGAKNVFIQLKTKGGKDTDLRLYDNNTMVVGFGGIIDSDTKITSTYKGDVIEYSGWAGGDEYIKIDSTSRPYIVKVYGFEEADYEVTIKYYYS